MADRNDVLQCPLCHGNGEVKRGDIIKKLGDAEKVAAYVNELRKEHPELVERRTNPAEVRPGGKRETDFERDVHTWNTKVSLWTRSNKE